MEKINVSFSIGIEAKIKTLINPIEGRFYISEDTHRLFNIIDKKIVKIGDVEIVSTEQERLNILSPLLKLYYVEETGGLFRYTTETGWEQYLTKNDIQTLMSNVIPEIKIITEEI